MIKVFKNKVQGCCTPLSKLFSVKINSEWLPQFHKYTIYPGHDEMSFLINYSLSTYMTVIFTINKYHVPTQMNVHESIIPNKM